MSKFRKRPNVVKYVKAREINEEICDILQKKLLVTDRIIDRLGLEVELEGHRGCVNCLEWSESGRFLASGSDDTNVILWDPFSKKLLYTYPTFHRGNIFTVKFLPRSNDTKIVTGAADFQLMALDAVTKEIYYVCSCPDSRIKRIATSPDSPDVFWSVSEDGIIRQTDLRLPHTCDDQSKNVMINLKNHQGASASGKCITVNPLRTELLAVGSNDPYIRIYDRRMITITTRLESSEWHNNLPEEYFNESCSENNIAIPWKVTDNVISGCVQYFVPGHLRIDNGSLRSKQVTYLSFSPDGRELLANLGSEQIYLFDITKKHAPKYFTIPNIFTENHGAVKPSYCEYSNGVVNNSCANEHKRKEDLPEPVELLKLKANEYFKIGEYLKAIRNYNEAIEEYHYSAVLFSNRAAAYMKRNWKGDMYAALRDCHAALQLDPKYMKAFFRLARCFLELKQYEEAKGCLNLFKIKFPSQAESHAFRVLEKDIEVACKKNKNKTRKYSKHDTWAKRSVFVSSDSDETYVANRNTDLHVSRPEKLWRSNAFDYESRYCGHCNSITDIKEANFFGHDGRYIIAGSDDGSIFFWNRFTENNIRILKGDTSIVNCVQPHPSYCLLASSGVDSVVRLWTPMPEEGWLNDHIVENIELAAEKNHKRLWRNYIVFDNHSEEYFESDEPLHSCRPS